MSLFVLILKFIGFGIGIIFALILAVILFVLFWPVKYNISTSYLGGILSYDIEVSWFVKLLLIRFANNPGKGDKILRLANKDFLKKTDISKPSRPEQKETDSSYESGIENIAESENKSLSNKEAGEASESKSKSEDNTSESILDRFQNILHTVKKAYDNPDKSDIIKESVILLKRLAQAIKTRVFNINCEIGLETPDVTAYAVGGLSILKAILDRKGRNIYIKGNFHEQVINAGCEIKGKLRLWSALWPLVVFVFTRPIWRIIKVKLFKRNKM